MFKYILAVLALVFSWICLSNATELSGLVFNIFNPPNWLFIFAFRYIDSGSVLYETVNNVFFQAGIMILFWFVVGLLIDILNKRSVGL